MTSTVHRRVESAIRQIGQGVYGVACSGGADSLALADAAIDVAGAANVVVLTIDHGLAPGSADVAAGVAAWARSRGAAAVVERVEVPRRASLEAAARDARHAALARLAEQLGLVAVLFGHTARDQAETVLMRILRGTGPAGLVAMRARERPLLALDRAEIEAYVAARGLPVWNDPMNADPRFTRVRVRTQILPLLRAENPQLDAALVRLAASTAEWLDVIDAIARPHATLPIELAALRAQPPAIRKRAVALALEAARIEHDAAHLEAIDRVVMQPARGEVSLDLPGARIVRTYDRLDLARPHAHVELVPPTGPYELRVWRPGDRMRPARLKGRSRKLSDLYVDAKIPRAQRATARVLVRTTDAVIVWAEHLGPAFDEPASVVPKAVQMGGSF